MKRAILIPCICLLSVYVLIAQSVPVAVSDLYQPLINISQDTVVEFNVISNDFDPDGAAIKILDVTTADGTVYENHTETTVSVPFTQIYDLAAKGYKYRVCEVNNPASVSGWADISVNAAMSPHAPVAVSDTGITIPGYSAYINLLKNDADPENDSITIFPQNLEMVSDSTVRISTSSANLSYYQIEKGYKKFNYIVSDTNPWTLNFDVGEIYIKLEHNTFYNSVNINNINARFNAFGHHFWDLPGGTGASFFVPNGTEKLALFCNTLWIGGMDNMETLCLAGERYRQMGEDYWCGPVADSYDSLYDARWFHAWKLSQDEITYHRDNWWKPDYVCPEDIFTWPGTGDVNNGEALDLAPYCDYNSNGFYDPLQGDYPYIKGDQAVFFIFNDARSLHTETDGLPLGIEVHGMAYAFDEPQDSALWNTLFMHYDIINRSTKTYHDTYLGSFTDMDLGYAWDDFVGSHVEGGFYYGYNGTPIDGNGEPEAYGDHPPAIGILFLGGPELLPDGIDNPAGGCDEGINGMNFGDTIVDNERMGLTGFASFINSGTVTGDPSIAVEYYRYLAGYWKDNTPLLYGGNGHEGSGALGPECRFMYPGDSDPCNWGTGGVWPNGGYNQNGLYWDETTVGNSPDDRRGLGVSGPFTFLPDQVVQFDQAFVFARDFDGTNLTSVDLLEERCSYLKTLFEYDETMFNNLRENKHQPGPYVHVFPNPASGAVTFTIRGNIAAEGPVRIMVTNLQGQCVSTNVIPEGSSSLKISVNDLKPGLYFYSLSNDKGITGSGKLMIK